MSVMATIHLHGDLATMFQSSYRLAVNSPREAIHALSMMVSGFTEAIKEGSYRCIVGDQESGKHLGDAVELCRTWSVGESDFHIIPVVAGAGANGGVGKIIVGIAMIAIAVITAIPSGGTSLVALGSAMSATAFTAPIIGAVSYASIAMVGALVVLSGIAMAISPQPQDQSLQNTQNSWLFNNLQNSAQEGSVVPYVYGEYLVGSVMIASGMSTTNIAIGVPPLPGNDDVSEIIYNNGQL